MLSLLTSVVAVFILLLGAVSMVSPIPGGTLFIAVGFSMLICSSPKAQACVRYVRTKSKKVNKIIFLLENKVGVRINFIGTALAKTQPVVDTNTHVDTDN